MVDNVIAFPNGRASKKSVDSADTAKDLNASVSRHPAGKSQSTSIPAETNVDYDYIGVKQILPAGMQTTNIEEIDYRIQRLDAVLSSIATRTSETDMARLSQFIKEALVTTAEITYFEGLAEGYTSYELEEDEDN